jgi:PAS domain S-box-containing protein
MRESLKNIDNFRKLLENISDGIIAMDTDWTIVYANQTAGKILGCDINTLIDKNIWQVFPQSVGNDFYKSYHAAMQTQKSFSMEGFSEIAGCWIKSFIYSTPVGVIVYFKDVTDEIRAAARAEQSEKNYRLFLDRITDGFIALDAHYRYVYVNKKIGEMVRQEPESLIGKTMWEAFPQLVGSATQKALNTAFTEQRFISTIDYFEPLRLWYEEYIYPSPDGLSIIIKDISDRKQLEEELQQQERRQQFEVMMTAIAAQEKERTFIAQELHDNVNQLLAATKLMLDWAKEQPCDMKDELLSKCITNIEASIEENRRISHELVTPDMKEENLVKQLKQLLQTMLSPKAIEFELDVAAFDEQVIDDARKLAIYRIAQEQCTNIVKYAKAKKVLLTLFNTDETFSMIIADDGVGTKQTKETAKGIGLRNIQARVNLFCGSLLIKTKPGQGFKLQVNIPVTALQTKV